MEKKKILIVDDEEGLTTVFKSLIENTGKYEVRKETRGSKALGAAKHFKPDLVLLDIMMPDIDGGEAAKQLKEDSDTKDIPIVFISAAITKEEESKRGIIKGGYPILAKPIPKGRLLTTIEKYTNGTTGSDEKSKEPPNNEKDDGQREERRRYRRVKVLNLLAYECMDEDDNQLERGMGRVLDISQTGLLLETQHLIESKNIRLSASGVQEDLIDIKGKVVYSKNSGLETCHTGVEFYEKGDQTHRFVVELIKAFNFHKDN
jgi:CheY-like chemotaxis protein